MTAGQRGGARAGLFNSRSRSRRLVSDAVLLVVAIVRLGPYAWMTITSLKTLPEITRAPAYPLPQAFQLGSYREVLRRCR